MAPEGILVVGFGVASVFAIRAVFALVAGVVWSVAMNREMTRCAEEARRNFQHAQRHAEAAQRSGYLLSLNRILNQTRFSDQPTN